MTWNISYWQSLQIYKDAGFDIVCITDHTNLVYTGCEPSRYFDFAKHQESYVYNSASPEDAIIEINSAEDGNYGNHHICILGLTCDHECEGVGEGCVDKIGDPDDNTSNGVPDCNTGDKENTQPRINCMKLKDEISVIAHPMGGGGFERSICSTLYDYTGVEIYNSNSGGKPDENPDTFDNDDWWDRALSYGHKSYCFASDDYERYESNDGTPAKANQGWTLINSRYDFNDYVISGSYDNFKNDIRAGNFYAVFTPDNYDLPLCSGFILECGYKIGNIPFNKDKGPKLIFKFINDTLIVLLVKDCINANSTCKEYSDKEEVYITFRGVSKIGGDGSEIVTANNIDLANIEMDKISNTNSINFSKIYSLDLNRIDDIEDYRAIRMILTQKRNGIDYVVYSQPYYLDNYTKNIYH